MKKLIFSFLIIVYIFWLHIDERNVIDYKHQSIKSEIAYRGMIREMKLAGIYYNLDYMWINPEPEEYKGKPFKKFILKGGSIKIGSFAYARKWKGQEVNEISYH